ncbi:hypothetical protein SLITK23_43940 [Streptomyces lividans]|uniref:DUF1795 domain-containing protein n=1 Tax=Streptomyces lividans TK24 TaxID=457428 RepID=A0ABM5R1P7_STRLI|nr:MULTISPECIES: hypothetical protein [Streptomyces]QSJ09650.1 hypothetical protein SLIVDG2_15715 [Streptomyces lividans]WTC49345.1 hypothetical protein OG855_16955 [Streptomyces anthocyanicus]AIJ14120.1 hypothetical protein SLIV_15715 [Streptomyces lividans TK24]EFD67513.1 predicted protein [Streptomyces lividans TK24]MBQ0951098.1 hypothetical protein [Streptomyces sp. RK76]
MTADQSAAVGREGAPATGYRLLLPSQWAQIPLRQGTEEAVEKILQAAYARIPADAPPDKIGPYKRELSRRFRAAVAGAQERNALDLYLPVEPVGDEEFNLGASILVTETVLPMRNAQGPRTPPGEIAVQLLTKNGAEGGDLSSGEVDGALAVRREHVAAAAPDRGAAAGSRRVEYMVSVPGDPDRWFIAAFSTVGGGDPRDELAEALVEWFDAVMATFRWRHV